MKIRLLLVASALLVGLSGCADFIGGLVDILTDDPSPVCDKDSVGSRWKGMTCDKYDDGRYRWTEDSAQ